MLPRLFCRIDVDKTIPIVTFLQFWFFYAFLSWAFMHIPILHTHTNFANKRTGKPEKVRYTVC